jgi:carbonic anhydrase/acetyltransferase-like protein (isoleucine patch superfamily)
MSQTPFILSHHGYQPQLDQVSYIAPNATIIGEVLAGRDCSFWFGCVVRGDVHRIEIGHSTNVQDLSMLHVSYKKAGLTIGDEVTIGHSCILHGCTVGNRVLIGMGSVLMDHVKIGDDCLIGAGTLITENTIIPPRSLVLGRPGKVVRPLNDQEIASLLTSANHYKHVANSYRGGPWPY